MRRPHARVTGASPDLAHQEPGWAIDCSIEQARFLSRLYRQRAFWWIDSGRLWEHASHGPGRLDRGEFSDRWRA